MQRMEGEEGLGDRKESLKCRRQEEEGEEPYFDPSIIAVQRDIKEGRIGRQTQRCIEEAIRGGCQETDGEGLVPL